MTFPHDPTLRTPQEAGQDAAHPDGHGERTAPLAEPDAPSPVAGVGQAEERSGQPADHGPTPSPAEPAPEATRASDPYGLGGVRSATVNWMSRVPDETPLQQMSLPGTHETCAQFNAMGGTDGWAVCQDAGLPWQLTAGVRVLDIRCKPAGDKEIDIYHGVVYQWRGLGDVIQQCREFLRDHPTEALVMRVKCEGGSEWELADRMAKYYVSTPLFYFSKSFPTLKDVRGKIMLISENAKIIEKFGCLPLPGSGNGEQAYVSNSFFWNQDHYKAGHQSTKQASISDALSKSMREPNRDYMIMNYTSTQWGQSTPFEIATLLNPYIMGRLTERYEPGKSVGAIMMDYADMPNTTEGARDIDLIGGIIRYNPRKPQTPELVNYQGGSVIWNHWTGMCLDSNGPGSAVVQWRYTGSPRQRWILHAFSYEGQVYYGLKAHEGGYLTGWATNDVKVEPKWSQSAEFVLEKAPGIPGGFYLRNRRHSWCLAAIGGKKDSKLGLAAPGYPDSVWYFDQRVDPWPNGTKGGDAAVEVSCATGETETGGYYQMACTLTSREAEIIPEGWRLELKLPPGVTIETVWGGADKHEEQLVSDLITTNDTTGARRLLVTLKGTVPLQPGKPVTIHYSGHSSSPEMGTKPEETRMKSH
ncbi:phosphatidylinositol-specific phospholipase C domain-containing protein [Streptomyces rubradiris]|uniref:phosphatidylinositol-specific phospholipase C domain-containing protein n=1 Tax=Streptomyces rubradiris TaxID=285531 RepID=UPI0022850CF1|nr:phosphatidylinositol-specific phospholipase C domain-containing protein [Streptomyces sp. UMAF16]